MKILKMLIHRKSGASTSYSYPKSYDAYKVVFGPIYEGGLEKGAQVARDRDDDDEYIVFGVRDADAEQFLQANNEDHPDLDHKFETCEITEEEASKLGESWTETTETITDQVAVQKVLAKAALGKTLTDADKAVLDPDDITPGINQSESFTASLKKALKQF